MPRALHNFKAAQDVGTGGFHQVFNEKFEATEWPNPKGGDPVKLKASNAKSWQDYASRFSKESTKWGDCVRTVQRLLRDSYESVLGGYNVEAKPVYLAEASRMMQELAPKES